MQTSFEYPFLPSETENPEQYTYQEIDVSDPESEEDIVTELENSENGQKPPNFKGYDLSDFKEKVIVGNFKVPHSKTGEIYKFLTDATAGLIFLTAENGEKEEKNPHLHFAIAKSKITPDTLKSYIRKKFPELVNSEKGGDKKYMAKYAKTLPYQVLYIFKEANKPEFGYLTNVICNDNKDELAEYLYQEYLKMHTTFSKTPAGQFYDYYLKSGGVKIGKGLGEVDIEMQGFEGNDGILDLRDKIGEIAIQYALETDNPNPGFQYLLKLINYVHLRVEKNSFQQYIRNKLHKDYIY